MQDIRWWAFWRRLQYGAGYFAILALIITGVYYGNFYSPANCFDGQKNGRELDVDCGGACTRICAFTVEPPQVLWAKSFLITDGQYNAVAYVENRNDTAGLRSLPYTFRLYDESGLIAERQGVTALPPGNTYPVFEGRINTGDRVPTETVLSLGAADPWLPSSFKRSQFKTSDILLSGADDRPRLSVTLDNTELTEAQNIEIVATIFDSRGTPLTASQTFMDYLPGRSSAEAVFTWPRPIAKTVRSCAVPTDIVVAIDLSGSMNNDNANPPQPITNVLLAAEAFVTNLCENDQVSVVTFASQGQINLPLTADFTSAGSLIKSLTIDPNEEQGNTNTSEALTRAADEFNSSRHNPDARRVIVLLTDGLATAPGAAPETVARDVATALKSDDITIYTIGLGQEVNMIFLRDIASGSDLAYAAPTTDTLSNIYQTITAAICEEGAARIDIIPKTVADFAPYP